ncbi:hypothetical protein T12_9418 [Trichinella patagoniensis]|uniref:Uncharacterized protein n=1 Tax=Trichinella patagoniensis TaxID=990121 RepID=A0A0V0ZK12_9BILA|nr:hypothetical protein T12_9418 [Trichinella patagoniensis]
MFFISLVQIFHLRLPVAFKERSVGQWPPRPAFRWITGGRAARRRSIKANVLSKGEDSDDSPLRKFGEVGSSGIAPAGNPAAGGAVVSKRLELEGSYGNLRVGKVGDCVERERRLWRVDVRRGAVGSSGQPVASRRMGAFAIQRIREKIRQGEMDISDKSHEAAVTKMKRRQWLPIGVDVRIEIDYYFGFVTGRMRRRATGGPVALEALFGWVARGRASPRWTAEFHPWTKQNVQIKQINFLLCRILKLNYIHYCTIKNGDQTSSFATGVESPAAGESRKFLRPFPVHRRFNTFISWKLTSSFQVGRCTACFFIKYLRDGLHFLRSPSLENRCHCQGCNHLHEDYNPRLRPHPSSCGLNPGILF